MDNWLTVRGPAVLGKADDTHVERIIINLHGFF